MFSFLSDAKRPTPKNGQIDLKSWDDERDGALYLRGEWEFYPDELIIPRNNEDVFVNYQNRKKIIQVPGSWKGYFSDETTEFGAGTYRLVIEVPKEQHYGIRIGRIRHANRLFLNGHDVGNSGMPTKDPDLYEPLDKRYIAIAQSEDNNVEVVIHVANLTNPTGGIVQDIQFGTAEQILNERDKDRAIEAFLVVGYLMLGIYFLGIYFQQRNETYHLYFSLFSIIHAIYLSTINERLLSLVLPDLGIYLLTNIQLTCIHGFVLFFMLYINQLLKSYAHKLGIYIFSSLLIGQIVLFGIPVFSRWLLTGVPLITRQLFVVAILLVCYVYILVILTKAYRDHTEESDYLLVIVTAFVCYGVLLCIDLLFEIQVGRLPVLLMLIMVLSLSLLMGGRANRSYLQVKQLSEELLVHNQMKDEFLVKTSHEIQTPLHGILNISQSLLEGREGPLKKNQQESVMLIHNVGKRLSSIVDDLLHASETNDIHMNVNPKAINIKVVKDIVNEMDVLIPKSDKVHLISRIPDNSPLIYADEQRLQQILYNLINNAIKFTNEGGIFVRAEIVGEEVRISVQDSGKGIAESDLKKIFTSFYQVKSGSNTAGKGLGLGLTITKQLVEALDGEIRVTSELGRGTCFIFTLPLATKEQLAETKENILSLPNLKNEHEINVNLKLPMRIVGNRKFTILIIDDNHINLKVLLDIVNTLGFSVIAADNGRDALRLIKEETIDLLLLDLMMPEMTGYEVCEVVRKEYHMVELPILIITAAGAPADYSASFQAGANGFIRKPIDAEDMKARIESILAMKKAAEQALHNELSFFHAQITPHFIYNTLNTIIAMSYKDQERTREALEHLATYFRAKLEFYNDHTMVTLEKELELVQAYLAIEQMRFGERLSVQYDIQDDIKVMIPTMTLQPLVENAVIHGISKKQGGGTLRIDVKKQSGNIFIVIADEGVGISPRKQMELMNQTTNRIGLSNIMKKLRLIRQSTFEIESQEGRGTKITITIPEVK